jgi:hypothetical protein
MVPTFSISYSTDDFTASLKCVVTLDSSANETMNVYLITSTNVIKNEIASGASNTSFWVTNDTTYTCIIEAKDDTSLTEDTQYQFTVKMVDLVFSESIGFTDNITVNVNDGEFPESPSIIGYHKQGSTIVKTAKSIVDHRIDFTDLSTLIDYNLFGYATYDDAGDEGDSLVSYTTKLSAMISESTTTEPTAVQSFTASLTADSYYYTHNLDSSSANTVELSWAKPANITTQECTYTITLYPNGDDVSYNTVFDAIVNPSTLTYTDPLTKTIGNTYQYSIKCTINNDGYNYDSPLAYSFVKFYTKPEILTVTSVESTVDSESRIVYPISGTYYVEEDAEITVSLSEEQTGGYTLDHIYVGNDGHTGTAGNTGHTGHDVISDELANVDTFTPITGTRPYFYTIQEEGPIGFTGSGPSSGLTGGIYDSPELNVVFKTYGALNDLNMSVVIPTVDYTNTGATGSTATVTWDDLPSCGLDQTIVYTLHIKSDTGCAGIYSPQGYLEETYTYTGTTGASYSLYPEDCYLFTLTATEVGPTGPAVTITESVDEYANRSSTKATNFTIEYKNLGPTYTAGTGPLCAIDTAVNYDAFTLLEYSADLPEYPGKDSTYSLNKNESDVEAIVLPVTDGIYGTTGATGSFDVSGNFKITSVNDAIAGEPTEIITKPSYTLPSVNNLALTFDVSGVHSILSITYTQSSAPNVYTELFIDDVFVQLSQEINGSYTKSYVTLTHRGTPYTVKARSYIVVDGRGYIGPNATVTRYLLSTPEINLSTAHTYTSEAVLLSVNASMYGYTFDSFTLERKDMEDTTPTYVATADQFLPSLTSTTVNNNLPNYGKYKYKCTMTYSNPHIGGSSTIYEIVDVHRYTIPLLVGTPSLELKRTVSATFNPQGAYITSYIIFAVPDSKEDMDEASLLTYVPDLIGDNMDNYTINKTFTFDIRDYMIIASNQGGLTIYEYTPS